MAGLQQKIADLLLEVGSSTEAVELYLAASGNLRAISAGGFADRPGSARSLGLAGQARRRAAQQGDLAAAQKLFEQGLEIRKRRAGANPRNLQAQRDLSVSYDKLGNASAAASRPGDG